MTLTEAKQLKEGEQLVLVQKVVVGEVHEVNRSGVTIGWVDGCKSYRAFDDLKDLSSLEEN